MQRPGAGAEEGLGGPEMGVTILVLDDHRSIVRAHTGFGKRQRSRTKSAFGGNSTDEPVRSAATRAVIHLVLAISDMITPRIRFPNIAGNDRHG